MFQVACGGIFNIVNIQPQQHHGGIGSTAEDAAG